MASVVEPVLEIDRYELFSAVGHGGMATVHLARQVGAKGFSRIVAVKRLHPQFTSSRDFVTLFLDEARLAACVRHPNVVSTLDVVERPPETLMVMEFVEGATLAQLAAAAAKAGLRHDPSIAVAVVVDMLRGLHAAHEARSERGEPLNVIHRDISPHNVIVGTDGVARLLDFGVAKAAGQLHATMTGVVRGKLAYMAPEHVLESATKLSDLYAVGVVLWEAIAGRRLFTGSNEAALMSSVLEGIVPPLSSVVPEVPAMLELVVQQALATDPRKRFASAAAMADALESVQHTARPHQIGAWVERSVPERLGALREMVAAIRERSASFDARPMSAAALTEAAVTSPSPQNGSHLVDHVDPSSRAADRTAPATASGLARAGRQTMTEIVPPPPIPAPPQMPQARRPRSVWVGALLAGGVGVALTVAVARPTISGSRTTGAESQPPASEPEPSASAVASASGSADTPQAASSVTASSASTGSASTESAPSESAPSESASASAPLASAVVASAAATGSVRKPATTGGSYAKPVASPAPADCDQPYEIDQNGIQRVKIRCFKVKR